jgi:hypothetical protein
MSKTKRGDFAGSSVIKDDLIIRSNGFLGSKPELNLSGDESLERFIAEIKAFYKSRLRESAFYKGLMERKVDINKLTVYRMLPHTEMREDIAEYAYSEIMKKVVLESYRNTMFVFHNKKRDVLIEVWPGNSPSTTTVYHEVRQEWYYTYTQNFLPHAMTGIKGKDWGRIREDWISEEMRWLLFPTLSDIHF